MSDLAVTTSAQELTREQAKAIQTRDVSIALSAGAGCGKTFVLTERFLVQLEPSASGRRETRLSELVAITFTERAAREMRDRIRRKCHERLMLADSSVIAEHWLSLLRQLEASRVSTIHSFCGSLLRAHAVEAGLDPRFGILEPNQASTLLSEAIDDELRRQLADRPPAIMDLVLAFGLSTLRSMVRIMLFQRFRIDFAEWAAKTPDDLLEAWHEFHTGNVRPALLRRLCESSEAQQLLKLLAEHEPTHPVMRARAAAMSALLPTLASRLDIKEALGALRESTMIQGGGGKGAWPSEDVYNDFKDLATKLRKKIDQVSGEAVFDRQAARMAAVHGLQLLEVTRPIIAAYESQKRDANFLDFDDLLIKAHDLLWSSEHEPLRNRLSSGIALLLVDEFQDTDPLQVKLVTAICGEALTGGKLFFVGDYKQSIYRFRGADPQVFRTLRESVPAKGRLPLTLNFRSQPAILHFVNALFHERLGPDYEALLAHRQQVAPLPAIEFLWAPLEQAGGEGESEGNSDKPGVRAQRELEAEWIARRLRAMIDSNEPRVYETVAGEPPRARAAKPRDIALLFRALSDLQYYEAALRRHGLPYYIVGGHAFYSQQEVFDVLNLLRSVNSVADEVSLAGVLRSPMFSLADETLFWLARHPQGLSAGLFAGKLPKQLSENETERARFAAETLQALRALKDRLPIVGLLNEALRRTGYDAVLLAEFLGERKLANLRKLLDQARGFDRAGIFTLADFISQLAEFVSAQPDEALAATHAEGTDVIRLMSIHQSKGLEFPIVVVPDLERRSHSSSAPAAFHPQLGPLVKMVEGPESAVSGLDMFKRMAEEEDAAEQARLLYVATTRAADYLIFSSGVVKLGEPRSAWMQLLAEHFELETGKLRGALPPGYAVPEILVTSSEPPLPESDPQSQKRPNLKAIVEELEQQTASERGTGSPGAGPLPADLRARRSFSFSRLSGSLVADAEAESPATLEGEPLGPLTGVDARGLGTLVHEVLAACEFGGKNDVAALVRKHASRHGADSDAEIATATDLVAGFLRSARAAEIASATSVYRELPFLLSWPPDDAANGRYVQGVIDCLYQDRHAAWHLVDYKTNHVSAAKVTQTAAQYELQMLLYALAIEQILGQPPETLTLQFLAPGVEHAFSWDAKRRTQVIDLVNQAIAAAVS
jgi:ATP-dependent helicase/nuclease subunit A